MHSIHKLAKYTALILVSALPISFDALAEAERKQTTLISMTTSKTDVINKQKLLAEKIQALINEAKDSLSATQQALISLDKNDPKGAKILLEDVLTKLDILLIKHPAMMLVPANVDVEVLDYEGDAQTLEQAVKQADDLLENGHLQSARRILAVLASELRITTISIPLGTFPNAIKGVIAQIDSQRNDEAKTLLEGLLNTLVEETEITPLPILRTEALLTKASEVEHQRNMSNADSRAEVLKYIDAAKNQLKIAALLGYGEKQDFYMLYSVIDDLRNEMHTDKSAVAWEEIKTALTDLKNKIIHM
jgi:YfdX protein